MLREIFHDQFADIRRREWLPTVLMSAFFFLVIAIFWILKPLKRGLLVSYFGDAPVTFFGLTFGGAEAEQIAKFLNVIAAYVVVIVFTILARRFPRHWLVAILTAFFGASFAVYAYLLQDVQSQLVVWSFYVLGDMFNTAMVVVFWAFTDDIWTPEEAKRTYGMVGLGGVVGGLVGATIVNATVEEAGRPPLLLWAILPLALIVIIAFVVNRLTTTREERRENHAAAPRKTTPAALEGGKLVFASRYLLAIAAIVGIYELVSNLVDFQLASTVETRVAGDLPKDAFFAMVGQVTGAASIVVQLLLTSWIMKSFGVKVALLFLPIAIATSSLGFLLLPTLVFATAMSASDNALNYSINQSAREALYTPTDPEVTYKAKAFIDMVVQRFGKVVAVGLNLGFVAIVTEEVRWLSLVTLGLATAWCFLILQVGRRFNEKAEGGRDADELAGPPPLHRAPVPRKKLG